LEIIDEEKSLIIFATGHLELRDDSKGKNIQGSIG
jgi:hypothetical protein